MAMSPYRFAIKEPTAQGMKSRTGLAGVTTGGATSGGEGFRASALRPGSSGYMAAGFGAAPRTDYVKPVVETPAPPPAPPAPEPAPTLAPELADPSAGANARGGNVAEGDGANGGTGGLSGEIGAPNSGWLADLMANIGLTNPGYGYDGDYGPQLPGASTQPGGQADVDGEAAMGVGGYDGSYGPQLPGDWGGGTSGAASGGAPSGGGTTGGGGAQSDADAAAEAEASGGGGGMGDGPSGPDAAGVEGYAKGGFVKGKAPFPGKAPMPPRKPNPLAGVGTGGMGAPPPNYADGGPVDAGALAGPNPPGPDDGIAALDGGEFVVQAQQAQRPDYGPILEQMNQGMYEPGEEMGEEGEEGMSTPGMVTDEGHTSGDPGALPPEQQAALMQAMQTDPMLAAALMQLLGPDAAHSMMDSTGGASPAPMATGRPPLAGPPPIPGAHAPPGVRPPAKAMPTQPMPPMPPRPMPGAGLGGVMA